MLDILKFRFNEWLRRNRIDIWWKRDQEKKILRIMANKRLDEHRNRERFISDVVGAFDGLERVVPCDYGVEKKAWNDYYWCHSVILQIAEDIREGRLVVGDAEKK